MNTGVEYRDFRAWFEISPAVYGVVGLVAIVLVALIIRADWQGSFNARISPHDIEIVHNSGNDGKSPQAINKTPEVTFARRWPTVPEQFLSKLANERGEIQEVVRPVKAPTLKRQSYRTKVARSYGHYYEMLRVQGDGYEGEFVVVKRQCNPAFQMPPPCYYPQKDRGKLPVYSD